MTKYIQEAIASNEMAYKRTDAIKLCLVLGFEFIDHFHKAMKEVKSGIDFEHHCKEMDTWWRTIKDIKLKQNNKQLSDEQLIDWFFTAGSDVDTRIEEPYRIIYKQLCAKLLKDRTTSNVLIIMNELLGDNYFNVEENK